MSEGFTLSNPFPKREERKYKRQQTTLNPSYVPKAKYANLISLKKASELTGIHYRTICRYATDCWCITCGKYFCSCKCEDADRKLIGDPRVEQYRRYPDQHGHKARVLFAKNVVDLFILINKETRSRKGPKGKRWKWNTEQKKKHSIHKKTHPKAIAHSIRLNTEIMPAWRKARDAKNAAIKAKGKAYREAKEKAGLVSVPNNASKDIKKTYTPYKSLKKARNKIQDKFDKEDSVNLNLKASRIKLL